MDGLGLAHLIRTRQISAAEVLEEAIARLIEVNPSLNAVAEKLFDRGRAQVAVTSPRAGAFSGVPIVMKDIGTTVGGVRQTAGSLLAGDYTPDHDGEYAKRLFGQGFVLFATSTAPEFGVVYATESTRFGKTLNPWDTALTPGGSSGGSAALVAAGVVPLAHANDGGGSIRIPASCTGLFGLKPTRARTPAGPDIGEHWSGLGIEFALTRTVRDAAALLDAVHGPELGAPYAAPPAAVSYQAAIARPPKRLRIAMCRSFGGHDVDPACIAAVEDAAALLRDLGHDVVEAAPALDIDQLQWALYVIIAANTRSVVDMIGMIRGAPATDDEIEPWTRLLVERSHSISAHDYANALTVIHRIGRDFATFLVDYDVLLTPTLGQRPQPVGELYTADIGQGFEAVCRRNLEFSPFTTLYNVSGHPAASVPLYWTEDDIPIGVQIGGRFGDEETLLTLAAELEGARPWFGRRPLSREHS